MTKKRKAKQKKKDTRVTVPLISWKAILIIFGIMYFLVVGQSFIVAAFLDEIPVLVSILGNYLLCTCVLLAVLFGLFWRYAIGKPLRKIAGAARKVAGGDFSIQIPPTQKKGRKIEIDVLIDDFNTMTRELASNEMLKSDFIANVSHEIKAPLSIIQSYTKALKDGTAAPEQHMKERGYHGGKVIISHCHNLVFADRLQSKIKELWQDAKISIMPTRGLCSYYAERGGLIVSY